MRFYVTNKDIREGWQIHSEKCAVARAVKRKFPDKFVCIGTKIAIGNKIYELSDKLRKFIKAWDVNPSSVKRINFRLDIKE